MLKSKIRMWEATVNTHSYLCYAGGGMQHGGEHHCTQDEVQVEEVMGWLQQVG